ncbi:MAG: cytochrome C oxidase subunit I [Betaproteobacteria bacterium]|jgi:hypothetical protein|nr:cytochrome C oxidase subunit I [Betaproteobacteria bacterium]
MNPQQQNSQLNPDSSMQQSEPGVSQRRRNLWPLWGVLAVTLAPVIASYITYYGIKPEGRTNYGDFVEPQVTVISLPVRPVISPKSESAFIAVQAEPRTRRPLTTLGDWSGRWLMVRIGPSECAQACQQELWLMRQLRLTTGRERDRVERLWILTDDGTPEASVMAEHEGLWVIRLGTTAGQDVLINNWLSVAAQSVARNAGASNIWMIDPLGNLMMRFPDNPDPSNMKKDLNRLLKASRIG